MRYIGSKEALLPFLAHICAVEGLARGTLLDPFAGTAAVSRHFKRLGWRVVSGDLMRYSYAFQRAYVVANRYPAFERLLAGPLAGEIGPTIRQLSFDSESEPLRRVIAWLNALPGERGFFWRNYSEAGSDGTDAPRKYLSPENAARIDAIRGRLAAWQAAGVIDDEEFHLLLASLIEAIPSVSNISGTYGAFLKEYDPRAHKPLTLEPPEIIPSDLTHAAHLADANALVRQVECDLLYLDPPYNTRQYATNYHLLETAAAGDEPPLRGRTGLRPIDGQRSRFCERNGAADALADLIDAARARQILLSYNDEGIVPAEVICAILARRGQPRVYRAPYRRFRSDRDRAGRRYRPPELLHENVYAVRVER